MSGRTHDKTCDEPGRRDDGKEKEKGGERKQESRGVRRKLLFRRSGPETPQGVPQVGFWPLIFLSDR